MKGIILGHLIFFPPLPRGIVYEVFHSDFLEWFRNETLGLSDDRYNVRHFLFLAENHAIDVLVNNYEPVISVSENNISVQEFLQRCKTKID
ncbi:MAG: hypothetical protein WCL30_00385 [Pseudomonadota bacterium]